ncbi:hypothetical protein RclHR1_14360003 [Rhizophagus clarus]|uniref:RING-type domain-containing protein n=1 Tax=Rhizophagus clarus TaxID=94130 RepID=A0A2Z6QS01_9GLOM|nr:hypothetical protein RclHR1_14360003 [Rhizophagus clarus]GES86008.1 hypothetical protein GLOIN_2v1509363 [Rhizophagus clarus]
MLNSQRNSNVNIRYISYPRQSVAELPHHSNHRYISSNNNNGLHQSDSSTSISSRQSSSSQNSSSSTNQITRLVRRLVNRNSSGSNNSPNSSNSRSLLSRNQSTRSQTTSTPAGSSPSSRSFLSSSVSNESDPFPFHNPWSDPLVPSSTSSNRASHNLINFTDQDYSSESSRNIQSSITSRSSLHPSHPLRSTRTSTPTPTPPPRPPRPSPPVSSDSFNSNLNTIREYFNIIPIFHDSSNLPHSSSRRRLSNSSYHSINHHPNNSSNDINFHDPFNHRRYLIQNHSSREAFCFLSKLPSDFNDDNDESEDSSSSSEIRSNNNYEFDYDQEEKHDQQKVDECYLCLESLELRGGRMIINPGCGHLLHMKCYLDYIKYFKEQCTLCKKDFGGWND